MREILNWLVRIKGGSNEVAAWTFAGVILAGVGSATAYEGDFCIGTRVEGAVLGAFEPEAFGLAHH